MNARVTAQTRKVWRQGGSLAITLPASFTKAHGIEEGDDLAVIADHIIKIVPMPEGRDEEPQKTS